MDIAGNGYANSNICYSIRQIGAQEVVYSRAVLSEASNTQRGVLGPTLSISSHFRERINDLDQRK